MEIKITNLQASEIEEFWQIFSKIISEDFPGYTPIVTAYFLNQIYTQANFRYWLQIGWRPVLVAKFNNRIVGFAVLDKPYGGVSFLRWLGVSKEYRHKGIGKQLITTWISIAKEACCHKVEVAGQDEARDFYEKAGLILEGERKLSYFGIDQYIYGKVIGKPEEEEMIRD